MALLAGCGGLAASRPAQADSAQDQTVLNTALAAELEAIAAYQAGAESGLLSAEVLQLALTFQGHHKEHAALLAETVQTLGGNPVEAQADYGFPLEALQNQTDVLRLAASLEAGAVSAYLGAVPLFDDSDLARAAASILGNEAMHWAVLRHAIAASWVAPPAASPASAIPPPWRPWS